MKLNADRIVPSGLTALRRLVQPRDNRERCDLCGKSLPDEHDHVMEMATHRLRCACEPCAILFGNSAAARFRRVPRRAEALPEFRLTDVQWEGLQIPINLAFFFHRTESGNVVAVYPSPGGPMEALPPRDAWQEIADENPVLRLLESDVETLLVNRLGSGPECYRVGIDRCFELIGILRSHWSGFSGGDAVWSEVARFFDQLKSRCGVGGDQTHA